MLVDDDPGILDAISIMLTFEGYEVWTASRGEELLTMKLYPNLILLDIWMSGTDGCDICQQLKNNVSTKNIPIILISANRDLSRLAEVAGADGILAKPFEMADLFATIKQHL